MKAGLFGALVAVPLLGLSPAALADDSGKVVLQLDQLQTVTAAGMADAMADARAMGFPTTAAMTETRSDVRETEETAFQTSTVATIEARQRGTSSAAGMNGSLAMSDSSANGFGTGDMEVVTTSNIFSGVMPGQAASNSSSSTMSVGVVNPGTSNASSAAMSVLGAGM